IRHLGERWVGLYEDFLDLAARARAAKPPEEMQHVFDLAARFMDRPLEEVRSFFDEIVSQFGELPAWAADPNRQPREVTISLVLTIDEALMEEFTAELGRLAGDF